MKTRFFLIKIAYVSRFLGVRHGGPILAALMGISASWGGLALLGMMANVAAPAPAAAECLIGGEVRQDIAAGGDCLEAQRTGCVRHLLTPEQYTRCLNDNAAAKRAGKTCIIGGVIRNDLSAADCAEGKATGCVKRLLTSEQYQRCLAAQPGNACVINGQVRNDLKGQDCEEAKATGCVRHLLSDAQYRSCLDAQKN